MHRDRDGPSRITTRQSCDTAPSRVVIRTTISIRSPDLGCQGNDTRSPRLALADKYFAIPKYRGDILLRNHSKSLERSRQTLHAIPRCSPRNNWTKVQVYHFIGVIEMWRTKRKIAMQRNIREDNILRKFFTQEIAFN